MWVETQCNKVDRRDVIACINLQLSGYASDLEWKKCGVWVETQCNKVDRRDSIACINLQLSGYASDLNGKNVVCGWRHSVIR